MTQDLKQGKNQIGLIGLGTMGAALARNLANHGYKTAVFNRTFTKTEEFIHKFGTKNLQAFEEIKDFVESLETPRKIILMVNAGDAVDQTIEHLKTFLEAQDILIDCGNSFWSDTIKRQSKLENDSKKVYFVGCGVSGGEEGALCGPSIMPGGDPKVVDQILPILKDISAKDFNNQPCVTNVGLAGAGHFVKMVHNGIEYALMQGIAEIYDILRYNSFTNLEIGHVFENLNQGDLKSFLLDITVDIFKTKDKFKDRLVDGFLIDKISDKAGAKGTGKWTVESALELGVAAPNISESLNARILSARNTGYKLGIYSDSEKISTKKLDIEDLKYVLQTVYITSYLQGLNIINAANQEYKWGIDIKEVLRIWQGGCIIRSEMLRSLILEFYTKSTTEKAGFLLEPFQKVNKYSELLPKPVISSTLNYILSHGSDPLPTNLIQAQRDFFGAHTYGRIDQSGVFTGGWSD
jgi:6-phosphogluconate dehydrogenase